jgi:predicted RNase H-like nuclease (RuvC/YqgF family)
MPTPSSDDEDEMLPTINEADSESLDSSHVESTAKKSDHEKEDKKKKKKKSRQQPKDDTSHILETSQQILVDLCNEMKSLQSSIVSSTSEATSSMMDNITSNTSLLHTIQTEIDLLKSNLKQLDGAIESKATPEQISEMSRIRAIQILLSEAQRDKEKSIQLYETHARRGYEEIERLRKDLDYERAENARLRNEMDQLRVQGHTNNTLLSSPMKCPPYNGPTMYINGHNELKSSEETIGTFDDMTLDTKQTTDNTVAYETKSLKKRIIHMKKKLQVAQLEAREAVGLRSELESLRLQMEKLKREGMEKDKMIQRLKEDIDALRRGQWVGDSAAGSSSRQVSGSSVTITTTTKKKGGGRWWNGLP